MPRRLIPLLAGLVLYGVSDSMLLLAGPGRAGPGRAGLGVDPWDVLHQGLARQTGIPTGTGAITVGAAVLLLWVPLRQRPGLGTLGNVALIGTVIDVILALVPPPHPLAHILVPLFSRPRPDVPGRRARRLRLLRCRPGRRSRRSLSPPGWSGRSRRRPARRRGRSAADRRTRGARGRRAAGRGGRGGSPAHA